MKMLMIENEFHFSKLFFRIENYFSELKINLIYAIQN